MEKSSENYQGIKIIQYFHQGKLNYAICIEEIENSFFSGEWFQRPEFHQGSLRSGFSRNTETGCIDNRTEKTCFREKIHV